MSSDVLKPAEVGKRLGVSPYTVLELIREGRLTAFKIRKQWRISLEDLEDFIAKGKIRKGDGNEDKN